MQDIDKLMELDIYFRYYELYKKYISSVQNQYNFLLEIKNRIKESSPPTKEPEKDISWKFENAVKKIEEENNIFGENFKSFDFSSNKVYENLNDYKILCYQFAKENIKKYLLVYMEKNGSFDDEKNFILYLDKLEILLWEFFRKNFFYNEEFLSIFDSAKADILKKEKTLYIQYTNGKSLSSL